MNLSSDEPPSSSQEYTVTGIASVCLEVLLMIIICFGNGLILVAFSRNVNLRRNLSNQYIVQVAVADVSVGMLMPMHIAMYLLPQMLNNIKVTVHFI